MTTGSNDDNDLFQFFDFNSKDLNWLLEAAKEREEQHRPTNSVGISNNGGSKRTRQGSIESSLKAAKLESFGRIIARSALPSNSISRSGHSFDNLVALVVRHFPLTTTSYLTF